MTSDLILNIDTTDVEKGIAAFKRWEADILAGELDIAMRSSLELVESQVTARTPVNTGTLRASITHDIDSPFPNLVGWVGTPQEPEGWVLAIEYGRTPGSKPPPFNAIALWATQKLGIPEDEIEQVSRLIALAIGHRGFSPEWDVGPEGARMFEEGTEVSTPFVNDIFRNAVKKSINQFKI